LLPLLEREVFALDKPFSSLGLPADGGVTGYFSPNMTPDDLTLIRDFFGDSKLSPLNTRAFKHGEGKFEITVGSINVSKSEHEFKGAKITVSYGEFAPFLEEVCYYLQRAREYAANEN
jgi:hypothetical protein